MTQGHRTKYQGKLCAYIDCEILKALEQDLGCPFIPVSSILEINGIENFYIIRNTRVTTLVIQKSLTNPPSNYSSFHFIPNFPRLSYLYIRNIKIPDLLEWIGILSTLHTLRLENLDLEMVPDSIGNLTSLVSLCLSNNQLKTLPASIGNLKSLNHINLDSNQLFTIPESIENLQALQFLCLRNNRIQSLPRSFALRLHTPMICWIQNNPILPESINRTQNYPEIHAYLLFCVTLPEALIEKIVGEIPLTEYELMCPLIYQYSALLEETCNRYNNSISQAILNLLHKEGRIKTANYELKL